MNYKEAFRAEHKGNCGPGGRGKFDGPWGRGTFGRFGGRHGGSQPAVNIGETDEAYTISLFAAGLTKEQVTLTVKDDVLTIAHPGAEPGTEDQPNMPTYTYQEYQPAAFKRSFRLNDKVLIEAISASYADGILTVTLPRNPETNKPAQTITVA